MILDSMDPQSEKAPGLHLPQPSVGEGVDFHAQYEDMPQKGEVFNASPEQGGSQPPAAPVAVIPQPAAAAPTSASDDTQGAAPKPQAVPLDDNAADDLDKEWVNKAKMIVEKTKDDPYVQSNEISKAKADYLKIRYNKHIKVTQDRSS